MVVTDHNGYFLVKPALVSVNGTTVAPTISEFKPLKHNDVIRLGNDYKTYLDMGRVTLL
jgi:hypothetical protein